MEYFWKQQNDIPQEMGYPLFGAAHLLSVGVTLLLVIAAMIVIRKKYFGEVAVVLIMPASLAALIFADWTIYYPVLNFINLHSYLWHGLLVLYPLLLYQAKEISPSIKHIHWVIIFLCLVVPPIYLFDKHFGCNYFFVNQPVPGTPLMWLASFMGNPGYLAGYALLVILVLALVYLIFWPLGTEVGDHF